MDLTRYQKAMDLHSKGFNCCQSVLAAFSVRFRNMEKCIDFLTTLFEGPIIRNLLWENGNRG